MKEIVVSVLALGVTGFLFSLFLALVSRKLKVEEDPRVEKVVDILPGINCGACGFSGCRVFAEAVVRKCNIFSGCLPGGYEVNTKIADILGIVGCGRKDKVTIVCHCGAEDSEKKSSHMYVGPKTCRATDITGGALDCVYGCPGFSDCVRACPTQALRLENRKIYVDIKKCVGCGKCVTVCPRNLFELVPFSPSPKTGQPPPEGEVPVANQAKEKDMDLYYVTCSNKDKASAVRGVCTRGCIGCGICTKVSNSPYYLRENLSRIDRNKVELKGPLQEGKDKCPTRCIASTHA